MPTLTRPAAVLWDFDGTLLDSERLWVASEMEVMASHGVEWTYEQGVSQCGASATDSMARLMGEAQSQLGHPLEVAQETVWQQITDGVLRRLQSDELPWLPGVRELAAELADAGVPMAIVSASPPELLGPAIARMPTGWFSTVVSGPEVSQGKPSPEGYLLAAERLGVDAADCIVIEDSVAGTQAGRAAGAVVIAVPCMYPLPTAPGQVNLESLAGVQQGDLARIWHEVRENDND